MLVHIYPYESYLNPGYTLSVPADYTAYGIADLIIHTLEAYFGRGKADLSDKYVIAIIKEALEAGIPLLSNLRSYEGRERIMWAATNALNGLTSYGREFGDWGVHSIGHNLSLLYDTPHGATLTIALPAWLRVLSERISERIIELGQALFDVNTVDETILKVEDMFRSINCPVRLQECGIDLDKKEEIVNQMINTKAQGMHHQFSDEERKQLVDFMYA